MSQKARLTAAIAWTLIIVVACSIPGRDLPKIEIDWIDKLAHAGLFFILAWLWLNASEGSIARRILWVVVLGSVFGILTELYQGILPWERTPDQWDALANTAGLIAGSAAFSGWKALFSSSASNL